MTPEERAARERKQKIFLVVGGLFLVALLAFQLPKLLGGSSSPEAAATTATTEPGQASPIASATSTATAANAANGIVTPPSGSSSVPRTAKLTSFTVFRPKDPFVQQVKTGIPITGGPASEAPAKTGATGEKPTTFSTGGAKVQSATIVVVNGVRQVLEPGTKFPASDPLFVLVAEKPGSKSVVIGIAGGAYSGGGKTTKLKVGKPLTLVNTATGARYKISLVSVGSGEAPDAGATNATGAGN